jgi:hypothetical protein
MLIVKTLIAVLIFGGFMQEQVFFQNNFNKYLSLSYTDFDQKPKSGWRSLAELEKYDEAAKSILFYIQNKQHLDEIQVANLYFHAGQMFAFENNYESAIIYFKKSILASEPEHAPVRWNDYVSASIAFLKRDRETLIFHRDEIAAKGTEIQGVIPNLAIVENLLNHIQMPYAEVYHMQNTRVRQGISA